MNDIQTRVGIDFRGDLFYVARIDHAVGRQEVKALMRLERQHLGDHHLLQGGQPVLAIADENIIVKKLVVNGNHDTDLRTRFELAQTLPQPDTDYHFDILESSLNDRFLGTAIHNDRLDQYVSNLLGDKKELLSAAAYRMRAVALAEGYINFCRKSGGDLVCLVDFVPTAASIAFIYQSALVDLCFQPTGRLDLTTEQGLKSIAVELKTLVNFRSASLFSDGITTPLTCMVVSGEFIDDRAIAILKKYFSIDINRPSINTGFISSQADLSAVPLEKYLVALGLASN